MLTIRSVDSIVFVNIACRKEGAVIDRRAKYTRLALRESLLKLVREKSVDKITVTDICKEADINRGTFYTHYKDAYDLLQSIEDAIAKDIESVLTSMQYSKSGNNVSSVVQEVFEYLMSNKAPCEILLGKFGDMEFLRRILYQTQSQFTAIILRQIGDVDETMLQYYFSFVANGCVGLVRSWIMNDMQETPEKLASVVATIANEGGLALFT
ncbi:MAG: TetR/AcrR family transcriptional regulator [Clostridiales bacterium]|nr:TetR/AcrR family transcriptional regulator [Clostridiales bacterium]